MRIPTVPVVLLIVAACRSKNDGAPRHRPSSVPATASWVGGTKGGVFIQCARATREADAGSVPIYRCDVFNDWTGEVRESGYFQLTGATDFDPSIPDPYSEWPGDRIGLRSGALIVVEPPRPPAVPPNARWGGGARCGAFVACRPASRPTEATCEAYDPYTGALTLSGLFVDERGKSIDLGAVDGRCPSWPAIHMRGDRSLWKIDAMLEPARDGPDSSP